jgi:predicted metal-binding membrane protein
MSAAEARAGAPGPAVLSAILGAWAVLLVGAATPADRYLSHRYEPASATGQLVAVGLYLVGWLLMSVAMMLPTAGRLLGDFDAVVARRDDRRRLTVLLVGGFLAAWLATGYVFRTGDVLVHLAVDASAWLQHRTALIGGGTIVAAGLYQLSDVKHRCLTACRTPRGFVFRHWRGGRPGHDAFRVGLAYGASCVGCCWALMLMMFGLGTTSPWWMLTLTAVMAAEKNLRIGARMARPLGVALIALGLAVALV